MYLFLFWSLGIFIIPGFLLILFEGDKRELYNFLEYQELDPDPCFTFILILSMGPILWLILIIHYFIED